jgi:hypothetical protein
MRTYYIGYRSYEYNNNCEFNYIPLRLGEAQE